MAKRDATQGAGRTDGKAVDAAAKPGRAAQLKAAYRMARQADPRLPWRLLGVGLAVVLVCISLGLLLDSPIVFGLLSVPLALLAVVIVFGKRAEKAVYASAEGQLGAAASVLDTMRGRWTVTPAVAATKASDLVHRVVGACGIVLVGEGAPQRLTSLFAQERKKLQRMAPDVPVTELIVGNGAGQVPLSALQRKVMKLPRTVRPAQVAEVDRRLKALGAMNPPIPKGPLPKGARMPKGPQAR